MALHKICVGGGIQHTMKKWTQQDLLFCKNEGSNDLMTMKKGVNKIKNQGENWYKLLQNCQMRDFCEKIDQL